MDSRVVFGALYTVFSTAGATEQRFRPRNAGEACTAANRFYVQRGIHDAFVAKLVERMGAMKMGPGLDSATPQ